MDRISRRVYWSCLHVLNFFGKLFSSTSTFKLRWLRDDWRAEGKPNRHSSIEFHIKSSLTLASASKLTSETLTPPRATKNFWSAHGCSTGNFFHRSSQDWWKKKFRCWVPNFLRCYDTALEKLSVLAVATHWFFSFVHPQSGDNWSGVLCQVNL